MVFARSRTRERRPWSCRRCSRSKSRPRTPRTRCTPITARTANPRQAATSPTWRTTTVASRAISTRCSGQSPSVDIPVIASLNAVTLEGWTTYAAKLEQAGAAALELNLYFIPTDLTMSGQDVEARYVQAVVAVKRTVKIPVAVKLSPYFSSIGNMAQQLADAGCRRPRAVQSVLPARLRPCHAGRSSRN